MERYSRQIMLPNFGKDGQKMLFDSTIGILGVGGLGCPAATYLAAAGVGRIVLVDSQCPDESNLNRQILHWPEDIENVSKTESAAWKLRAFNPNIEVLSKTMRVCKSNINSVFKDVDVILDCTDSFDIRMILNDYCIESETPYVHAAVESWHGQITTIIPKTTPCLKCIFPNPPHKKDVFPIIGVAAGVFGSLEASEAIKIITKTGDLLASKLLMGDLQHNQWDIIEIKKRDKCPACTSV